MRIVSLLPGATETLFALGLGDQVVGISHDCDYPPEALTKPILTRSRLPEKDLSSEEIDRLVREIMQTQGSLYEIDQELLLSLKPDLIITQELCPVCAVSPRDIEKAIAGWPQRPRLLTFDPKTLGEVLLGILRIGALTHSAQAAQRLVNQLESRIRFVAEEVGAAAERIPKVFCMEWLSPPMNSGHWIPELVQMAGGNDPLGNVGQPSVPISWERIFQWDPEFLVMIPCGMSPSRMAQELDRTNFPETWYSLSAVQQRQVFLVDARAYFTRPGPRLVDSLEILARILHPSLFGRPAPPGAVLKTSSFGPPPLPGQWSRCLEPYS